MPQAPNKNIWFRVTCCLLLATSLLSAQTGPNLQHGIRTGVGSDWQEVLFDSPYTDTPAVVTTPAALGATDPIVVRVQDVSPTGFRFRLQQTEGLPLPGMDDSLSVHWLAMATGTWSSAIHGISAEARWETPTHMDHSRDWSGMTIVPQQSYQQPVVLGQAVGDAEAWQVFWARGAARSQAPSSEEIRVGLHRGEAGSSSDLDRMAVIIIEADDTTTGSTTVSAFTTPDEIRGYDNPADEVAWDIGPVDTVIGSMAGMDGGNGGWPLWRSLPDSISIEAVIDEDRHRDDERWHTSERLGVIALASHAGVNTPPSLTIDLVARSTDTPTLLSGTASDSEDGDLSSAITWHSDRDGDLGTGGAIYRSLSPGRHLITATVADSGGYERQQQASLFVATQAIADGPKPRILHVTGITSDTATIDLPEPYAAPLAFATPIQMVDSDAVVAQIIAADSTTVTLRLQHPAGDTISARSLQLLVVESGLWPASEGFPYEARTIASTDVGGSGAWDAWQDVTTTVPFDQPVVLAQVVSDDPDWSVATVSGATMGSTPSSGAIRVIRQVAEDPDRARGPAELVVLVAEAGVWDLPAGRIEAGLSSDSIRGIDNSAPYTVPTGGHSADRPLHRAVTTLARMDGNNGGWPVLIGPDPFLGGALQVAVAEDRLRDNERSHTSEAVSYIAGFSSAPILSAPLPAPPVIANYDEAESRYRWPVLSTESVDLSAGELSQWPILGITAADAEEGDLSDLITWSLASGRVLGTGTVDLATLSPPLESGTYTVIASVVDDSGLSDSTTFPLAVTVQQRLDQQRPLSMGPADVALVDVLQMPDTRPQSGKAWARLNDLSFAGNGSDGFLYTNDMRGQLYRLDLDADTPAAELMLDVYAHRSVHPHGDDGQLGLTAFTFDPEWPAVPVLYTVQSEHWSGGKPDYWHAMTDKAGRHVWTTHDEVITAWTWDLAADTVTQVVEILRIRQPYKDHNANMIRFNPMAQPGDADWRVLYSSIADGGNRWPHKYTDPLGHGQDTSVIFGSMLRILPDHMNGGYSIPSDNPFIGNDDVLDEIWAYGLRNTQRFAWDTPTATLIMSEIGQDNLDEINIGHVGANYGWSWREGTWAHPGDAGPHMGFGPNTSTSLLAPAPAVDPRPFHYPAIQIDHETDMLRAVVGGYPVRGGPVVPLHDQYLFGDLALGLLWTCPIDDLIAADNTGTGLLEQLEVVDSTGAPTTVADQVALVRPDKVKNDGSIRADMRFGRSNSNRIFVLTKTDGMIRELVATGASLQTNQ